MERLFATSDGRYWGGGHYELDIRLGDQSEERVRLALETLWADERLEGPYLDRNRAPRSQQPADPRDGLSETLSGVATLPDGAGVLCSSIVIPVEGEYLLSFYVPVNALAVAWPRIGDFPFVGGRSSPAEDEDEDRAWQEPLEEWLAGFGRAVFEAVPFPSALIGFELSMDEDEEKRLLEELPEQRWVGVLRREQDELAWYPATSWGRIDIDWSRPDSWQGIFRLWRATGRLGLAVLGRDLRRLFGRS